MSMILRKEGPCEFNRRLIMCQQEVGDAHMIAKKFYPRGRWCECEFKSKVQRGCQQRSKLLCNVQLSYKKKWKICLDDLVNMCNKNKLNEKDICYKNIFMVIIILSTVIIFYFQHVLITVHNNNRGYRIRVIRFESQHQYFFNKNKCVP